MRYLTGDRNLFVVFVSHGAGRGIGIVEDDRRGGLGYTRLTLLVYEFLKISNTHLQLNYPLILRSMRFAIPD